MTTCETRNTPTMPQDLHEMVLARLAAKNHFVGKDSQYAAPGQVWAVETPIALLDTCTYEEVMPTIFIQDYVANEDGSKILDTFYCYLVLSKDNRPKIGAGHKHAPFVDSRDLDSKSPEDPLSGFISFIHPVYIKRDWCRTLLADYGQSSTAKVWKQTMAWAMSDSPETDPDCEYDLPGGYTLDELMTVIKDGYALEMQE